MSVYILTWKTPIGNQDNPHGMAHYYIGMTDRQTVEERIAEHRAGHGASLTRAVSQQYGYDLILVAVFPGGRCLEKRIKAYKNTPRLLKQLASGNDPDWLPRPDYLDVALTQQERPT